MEGEKKVAEYTGNCQLRSTPSYNKTDVLRVCVRIIHVCVIVCVYVNGGGYGRFMNRPICPSQRFSRAHVVVKSIGKIKPISSLACQF